MSELSGSQSHGRACSLAERSHEEIGEGASGILGASQIALKDVLDQSLELSEYRSPGALPLQSLYPCATFLKVNRSFSIFDLELLLSNKITLLESRSSPIKFRVCYLATAY